MKNSILKCFFALASMFLTTLAAEAGYTVYIRGEVTQSNSNWSWGTTAKKTAQELFNAAIQNDSTSANRLYHYTSATGSSKSRYYAYQIDTIVLMTDVTLDTSVTLTKNLTIKGNTSATAATITFGGQGQFKVTGAYTLTLTDVVLDGASTTRTNPALWFEGSSSALALNTGAVIKNFTINSSGSAPAVYVANGTFTMATGAVIQDCSSESKKVGGGAIHASGATLTLNEGTIKNCRAALGGGAICAANSAVTLKVMTITGNVGNTANASGVYGGGISLADAGATLTIAGNAKVTDNWNGTGSSAVLDNVSTYNMTEEAASQFIVSGGSAGLANASVGVRRPFTGNAKGQRFGKATGTVADDELAVFHWDGDPEGAKFVAALDGQNLIWQADGASFSLPDEAEAFVAALEEARDATEDVDIAVSLMGDCTRVDLASIIVPAPVQLVIDLAGNTLMADPRSRRARRSSLKIPRPISPVCSRASSRWRTALR